MLDGVLESLLAGVAALLAVGGIALLVVGTYLTGLSWPGLASVVGGVALFAVGTLVLRRRDSAVADRLLTAVKELFLGT